jgi:hypothetical protein
MTRWIEQQDEPADGTTDGAAMDGGDGTEQWQVWCSGGTSRGEAQWREQRWLWRRHDCRVVAAAWLLGCGGGATTGGAVDKMAREDNGAAAAWEDNGGAVEDE